ncbi:MAG: glutamate-5-semialdehyde dehydrogenase [Paludibacteraceae bacterium]|nr:glutamate-5-semialdehyde dehydrogenase [Paludibacteraceae bacterium]
MEMQDWKQAAQTAARELNRVDDAVKVRVLNAVADAIGQQLATLLEENRKDLDAMDPTDPLYDRLQLTESRLRDIAADMRKVAGLPSPLHRILEQRTLPNGLQLRKVSVPFGVVGIIYEARPNVSFDVFSLCFKSGNVCVLKGGSNAHHSNTAIVQLIQSVLTAHGLNPHMIHLMPAGRESTAELLNAVGYVDLIFPRGSAGLIQYVRDNAKVPVIETGAGVVHAYFDEAGDLEKGIAIITNAKTRRVSVCNALDGLIIHQKRLADLPALCRSLGQKQVIIEADPKSFTFLDGHYPAELLKRADEHSFGTEFMALRMSIKTVENYEEALAHIARYSSRHSECIITENAERGRNFQEEVDAACVYVNAPTSFTDGGQFGMGAEIGISTQKLHARGPMALPELCTYKWLIDGNGQTRP